MSDRIPLLDHLPLSALDRDRRRRYTAPRADLPRLVRKLRHRGFRDVTVTHTDTEVRVHGTHRLRGGRLELTLLPAVAGHDAARRWTLVLRRSDGSVLLDDLWVGTKYRWRVLDECDDPGYVAATAARVAGRLTLWRPAITWR